MKKQIWMQTHYDNIGGIVSDTSELDGRSKAAAQRHYSERPMYTGNEPQNNTNNTSNNRHRC